MSTTCKCLLSLCRIAGSETSSTAMTFTLMFLVQNQDKLAKLREELDLATASNAPGTLPSYDQVRNLPYLTGCINESLRLRPVAATGSSPHFCIRHGIYLIDSRLMAPIFLPLLQVCRTKSMKT